MSGSRKSIVLISNNSNVSTNVGAALRALPNVDLEERSATLSEMNGSAVELADRHDLVIFKTEAASDNDIQAIRDIRMKLGREAVILALSSGETSLSEVRRLTAAGVNDVLLDTVSTDDLQAEIERWTSAPLQLTQPLSSEGDHREGKLLTVAQARGGIGSTTVAVNLADSLLALTGRRKKSATRVALVDLDVQFGTISTFLDVPPSEALFQMAIDGIEPDVLFLKQAMSTLESGLSVLTAPIGFAPMEALTKGQIARLLDLLKVEFDYVVVDLPRTLVGWIAPVLEQSDQLLIVTDVTVPAIRQARRLIDFYTEDNLDLSISVVVNHEKKPLLKARHYTEAAKVLERPLQYWIPDDPKTAREAVDRGAPLSKISKRAPITKSIKNIGKDMIARLETFNTKNKSAY